LVNKLLSGRRVLVIEDELIILMMIEDMLADLGCESVVTVATVEKALVAIDSQAIDLAMLDMNLNGDKSPAVAEALTARGIPFVYSTGNGGSNIRDGYHDRPVLKKPFRNEELVEILTRLLSR
jgi:CheY-like chemotaxis protein